jgi:hypothetical protein
VWLLAWLATVLSGEHLSSFTSDTIKINMGTDMAPSNAFEEVFQLMRSNFISRGSYNASEWTALHSRFAEGGASASTKTAHRAVRRFLDTFGDPYTTFFEPTTMDKRSQAFHGERRSVGIALQTTFSPARWAARVKKGGGVGAAMRDALPQSRPTGGVARARAWTLQASVVAAVAGAAAHAAAGLLEAGAGAGAATPFPPTPTHYHHAFQSVLPFVPVLAPTAVAHVKRWALLVAVGAGIVGVAVASAECLLFTARLARLGSVLRVSE